MLIERLLLIDDAPNALLPSHKNLNCALTEDNWQLSELSDPEKNS